MFILAYSIKETNKFRLWEYRNLYTYVQNVYVRHTDKNIIAFIMHIIIIYYIYITLKNVCAGIIDDNNDTNNKLYQKHFIEQTKYTK